MHTLSVSALNEQIKTLLEGTFTRVFVRGECSRITYHSSGHIYFTLKDKDSAISAVMFRGNVTKLKFALEEGMDVVVDGAITLYKPRGSYQINCFSIEPSGQGALALAYEQLKQKLSQKGYFDPSHKKTLPKFPKKIALITSATGAALQDMLRVANKRYRAVELFVYDVLVQGEGAASQIANAITQADAQGYDVVVMGRGGGSQEDLWAFNEEVVADAVFAAQTPVVSAVGHEIDYLISDFVADLRAPTPSAAMEMVLPDTNELYMTLDTLAMQATRQVTQKMVSAQQNLEHFKHSFEQHSFEKKLQHKYNELQQLREGFVQHMEFKITSATQELQSLGQRYPQTIDAIMHLAHNKLHSLTKMLEANHPKLKTKKGFAQIAQEGKIVEITTLQKGDVFEVQNDAVVLKAQVLERRELLKHK